MVRCMRRVSLSANLCLLVAIYISVCASADDIPVGRACSSGLCPATNMQGMDDVHLMQKRVELTLVPASNETAMGNHQLLFQANGHSYTRINNGYCDGFVPLWSNQSQGGSLDACYDLAKNDARCSDKFSYCGTYPEICYDGWCRCDAYNGGSGCEDDGTRNGGWNYYQKVSIPWAKDVQDVNSLALSMSPQSDKFTTHSYQTMYGTFLGPLARSGRKAKILEIGLGCDMTYGPGASVKLWRKMFPTSELWEADYDGNCVQKSRAKGQLQGVNTLVGDQGDKAVLGEWLQISGGNFDVVIDDGGHRNTQIKPSFDVMWPALKAGGIYFLEDLQIGRDEGWDETHGEMVMSDIVQAWVEQLLIAKSSDPVAAAEVKREALKWPLPENVDFIFCQKEACAIGKSPNTSSTKSIEPKITSHIDMCFVKPNGRPTLCQTESPWRKSELLEALHEFIPIYQERPWKQNGGGQNINHLFALWFTIRQLKPTHIIESGVWAGLSTWVMRRAAGPHAWILSFDPDDSHLQYNDTSGRTLYFLGKDWVDIENVTWDPLISQDRRASTLVMLDDHQSVMKRIPKLLSQGFANYWYDDNTKHNDNCYGFAWMCDPLPKGQSRVEVGGANMPGSSAVNISMAEHERNLAYLQKRVDTYFEFPAIHDACANDTSASLISSSDQLSWWGLPDVAEETYGYAHFPPPYVRFRALDEDREVLLAEGESMNETLEPPLLRQLSGHTKQMFWHTLNNSRTEDPNTYWASYSNQTGVPAQPENVVLAHTYWRGPFTQKPALAVKSFLATQNMQKMHLIVWLEADTAENNEDLDFVRSHGAEVRIFNFSKEVQGTPLDGKFNMTATVFPGHEEWPVERTAADLVRYIVLHKHGGGLWFDADVLFLRDISSLLPYEFVYPWSKHGATGIPENHTLNAAVLRLFPNSSANNDMIARVANERLPFGLWGLTALRDDKRHPNLNIVDVEVLDALWKGSSYFDSSQRAQLIKDEPSRETTRFQWFYSSDINEREAGFSVLSSAKALTYHWHNNWDFHVEPGCAFSLYETFVDCVLSGSCTSVARSLHLPSRSSS